MKAIVYHNYGSPDVLRLEDIEKPIPDDDEVLVKVHAVSINSWDWDMLTGKPFEYRFFSVLYLLRNSLGLTILIFMYSWIALRALSPVIINPAFKKIGAEGFEPSTSAM